MDAAQSRLSVAMCTYNGAAYLSEQLESILHQTRLPDEMVICDDGSTDDTLAILEAFQQAAPFPVRLVKNPVNLGSTRNFEQAIRLCQDDIIALADQDDVWLPDKLRQNVAALEANPRVGLVFSDAEVVNARLRPVGIRIWQSVLFDTQTQTRLENGEALAVLMTRNVVTGATLAFRSQYRDVVLPVSDLWVHDAWIALMISLVADIAIIREPLVLYRQHSHNQIGIQMPPDGKEPARLGLLGRVRKSRRQDPYRQRSLHAQFQPVRDHVATLEAAYRLRASHADFSGLITHAGARGYLPKNRLRRLPIIFRELLSLRYHRFSAGGILPFGLSIALADILWDTQVAEADSAWARQNRLIRDQVRKTERAKRAFTVIPNERT